MRPTQSATSFFSDLFDFDELAYNETQENLLQIATFREAPLDHASYHREQCDFKLSGGRTATADVFFDAIP